MPLTILIAQFFKGACESASRIGSVFCLIAELAGGVEYGN
jgi:hypothetical protein